MIYTTLNRIRAHGPCESGWKKLLAHLGKTGADDEPLAMAEILASNGLNDALWCLRAEPQHARLWRLFAVRCARAAQHPMSDPRSVAALDVAERHANGLATDEELDAANDAAGAAWRACGAGSSAGAAWAAVEATWAAGEAGAAWAAAVEAVWAARGATREVAADILAVFSNNEAAPGQAT